MSAEPKTAVVTGRMAGQQATEERAQHSAELKKLHIGPLWEIYRSVLTPEPRQREVPYLWSWRLVRPHLLRAGELITAAEAERRALMLLNPGNERALGATGTLYAAAQLILPGEIARTHRHSPAALRFIIEGEGAFTCVEGEKIEMSPGDLVLTPSMVWHDHGNDHSQPVMWLDGLDIPLTDAINCMFLQEYPQQTQPQDKAPRHSEKLFGRALFPSNAAPAPPGSYSPVWAYRWTEAREALESLRRSGAPDRFEAYTVRYANPATGGETLPTMACRLRLIPKGAYTAAQRATTSAVYHVAEGSGYSVLNGMRFNWSKGDTFAVPIWCWQEHTAPEEDAVLFSFTDDPVISNLGLFHSQQYAEHGGFQPVTATFDLQT
jgi:gentisate 1,2-dioxygenase